MTIVPPLRLHHVSIRSFKAIAELDLAVAGLPVSLLVGPNGAGKTSVLQAVGFLRAFVDGRPEAFFDAHGWEMAAAISHVRERRVFAFATTVDLRDAADNSVAWTQAFNLSAGRSAAEVVEFAASGGKDEVVCSFGNGTLTFGKWGDPIKAMAPQGSILSAIRIDDHPDLTHRSVLQALRDWAGGITSLELLTPAAMRSVRRGKVTDIGVRGERLGAFLASLPAVAKERIVHRLAHFYPHLADLSTKAKRAGWVDLRIAESYSGRRLSVGSEHVSDGFLRLLALASIPEFPKSTSLVLLDEAENGIDPLILPDFLEAITNESHAQIILTTHSPILVNRFPPEAVHLLCRSEQGRTIGARLTDIPEFAEELEFRGAGEIWAHSSLTRITALVRAADQRRRQAAEAAK